MRKSSLVALPAATLLATPAVAAATEQSEPTAAQRYIVTLADNANPLSTASNHGVRALHVYRSALHGYSARMTAAKAERLEDRAGVESVTPDRRVHTPAQSTPTGIDRMDAELSGTANVDGNDERVNVDVAVIDSGVDLDHPDLNVHTEGAKNCSLGLSADDSNGHGTHVAGTVAALDNDDGVVGAAPGARIWPVRVLNSLGSGSWSDVICGVDYVTAHADEIEVANMSLGGSGGDDGNCGYTNDDPLHQAICNSVDAGVTYAVAAGNDSSDSANSVPASYDEVMTVSALADFDGAAGGNGTATCRSDQDDTFADFLRSRLGRGSDRAGRVHRIHLDERWLQHHLRYFDGLAARGGRCRAVLGEQPRSFAEDRRIRPARRGKHGLDPAR